MPIDPQLIRAGVAEVYLYQTTDQQQEPRVIKSQLGRLPKFGEAAAHAIDHSAQRPSLSTEPTVAGLFDAAGLKMDGTGKWVSISGQDYTDFLVKKQWKPLPNGRARRIPSGQRLDVALAEILAEADLEGRLRLVVENMDADDLPVVGKNETRSNRRGIPVETDTSYWDVMYGLAVRHGALIFVRGQRVILTRDRNLTDRYDPRVKRMAWGKNIESVNLSRKLGKQQAPTIVLRSYDARTRQTIEVDYPPNTFQKVKSRENDKTGRASIKKTEEYQVIPVYGITDRRVLLEAAELRYNRLARAEREMTLITRDLKDLYGDDLLSLRAGDAVLLDFEEFNRESIVNSDLPSAVKFAALRSRGFSASVAQVIVQHADKLRFLDRPLRIKDVSFDYSSDDGIRVEMTLQDFIVVDGIRDIETRPTRRDGREKRLGDKGFSKEREQANRRQFQ
jgi:hypothetical protein